MYHPPCDCRHCGQARAKCDEQATCFDACRERPCPPPCPPPRPHPPKPKPCPPKPCSCRRPEQESVLLQKIIGCERRSFPCVCACLRLEGLPECAEPPYKLVMVQQSGAQPWWTPLEGHLDGRLRIRVSVPVCCQVCDACGKLYHATSTVEVEASIRPPCPLSECWKHNLYVVPFVRLCRVDCTSECPVFEVKLEVCMDIYLLRPEPCLMRRAEPPCPELPLYPQPIKPQPCWPQCQEARDPYGWPAQG